MKRACMGLAVVAALTALSGQAWAKDRSGRLGVGFDTTLSGGSGVAVRYGVVPRVGVEGIMSFESESSSPMMGDLSSTRIDIGVLGTFDLIDVDGFVFDVIGGIVIQRSSQEVGGMSSSSTSTGIEVGVRPEIWLAEHFSLHLSLGMLFVTDDQSDDIIIGPIFNSSSLLGNAGFTFYF